MATAELNLIARNGLTVDQKAALEWLRSEAIGIGDNETVQRIDKLKRQAAECSRALGLTQGDADFIAQAEKVWTEKRARDQRVLPPSNRRAAKIGAYRDELNKRGLLPHESAAVYLRRVKLREIADDLAQPRSERAAASTKANQLDRVLNTWDSGRGRLVRTVEFSFEDAEAVLAAVKWYGSKPGETERAADEEMQRYCFDRADPRYDGTTCAMVRLNAAWADVVAPIADLADRLSGRLSAWAIRIRDHRLTE